MPDPVRGGLVASLATHNYPFSSLPTPSGQASLSRAVLSLWSRFYSRLFPLWSFRYTSPSGGPLLAGFGGGVCSASWEDCTTVMLG